MRLNTLIVMVLLIPSLSFSQNDRVQLPLKKYTGITFISWYRFSNDTVSSLFLLPKGANGTNSIISSFNLQPLQDKWKAVKEFQLKPNDFINSYNFKKNENPLIDTLKFTKSKLRNVLNVLTVLKDSNTAFVFPDYNLNNDFTDDLPIKIVFSHTESNSSFLKKITFSNIQIFDGRIFTYNSMTFEIKINFNNTEFKQNSIIEKRDWIEFGESEFKLAVFKKQKSIFRFLVATSPFANIVDYNIPNIILLEPNDTINVDTYLKKIAEGHSYKSIDTLLLNNTYYTVSLNRRIDTVSLKKIISKSLNGYNEGFYLKRTKFLNINNIDTFELKPNGSFLFIDFWGSWCQPCLKLFPKVTHFLRTYKDRYPINYISIAYDSEVNIEKIKEILSSNGLQGVHLFENRDNFYSNMNSGIKDFNITCYPTYMLVGRDGKVLLRTCGEDFFEKASKFLY